MKTVLIGRNKMTFEKISENNVMEIRQLAEKIFPQTYRGIISEEQIAFMMEMMYSEESLRRQILVEKQAIQLVRVDEEACGYFSLQPITESLVVLQKLYLLPALQGKGYGKAMLEAAVAYVQQEFPQTDSLQLYVNRANRAKDFYEHAGFCVVDTRDHAIGNGFFMNDYRMELRLRHPHRAE
ncbi:MAG: GNAT family N-acetyltransferase [Bacteroidales bacterium]